MECDGEDEESCAAHLSVLEKELQARPNVELIQEKIHQTASLRMDFIKVNTTAEVLQKYPWLKKPKLVRNCC